MIKSIDQTQTTRERLLEAAMDCFAERGFAGTTTRAICARAGVNLALLNYHWGSKDALWAAVVRVLNDRLAELAVEAACPAPTLPSAVAAFLSRVVRVVLADPRPLRVMVWASLQPEGFDGRVVEAAYGPVLGAGIALLQAEQAAGRIPASVDVGLSLVTFYGMLAEPVIEPAVHRHLFGRDGRDPEHALRLEKHLVRSGLLLLGLQEDP